MTFYEDSNGKWVVGADSVPKKLGSGEFHNMKLSVTHNEQFGKTTMYFPADVHGVDYIKVSVSAPESHCSNFSIYAWKGILDNSGYEELTSDCKDAKLVHTDGFIRIVPLAGDGNFTIDVSEYNYLTIEFSCLGRENHSFSQIGTSTMIIEAV